MRLVDQIKRKRILVIGDVMLDEYYIGKVDRISPEAPVPIFLQSDSRYTLGGAANVAVNLSANNQEVSVMAIIGKDPSGKILLDLLRSNSIDTKLLLETDRPTCTKCRLLAGNSQQVLRIDFEDSTDISNDIQNDLLKKFKNRIKDYDLIIISDYMKGLLTYEFTQSIIKEANRNDIKILVDVKDKRCHKYDGAFLIKPNKKELNMLTGKSLSTDEDIVNASRELCNICRSKFVLTTCGAQGMLLVGKNGEYKKLKTTAQEVFDVTGAGDTVIAYLGMCVANGLTIEEAMSISNCAAGVQVSKVGTSTVSIQEVARVVKDGNTASVNSYKRIAKKELSHLRDVNSSKSIVFTNGCFDILHIGHLRYLKKAASLGDILVVGLNSDDSVRRLKGSERPINNQYDRLEILAALDFVDYIVIFDEDTPYEVIKELEPDVLVKGGDYTPNEVVGKDIVESRGGRLELISFVDGKSTTNIINKIKNG